MGVVVDWILDFLYSLAVLSIGWLPDSPFQTDSFRKTLSGFSDLMSYINYFVPVGQMLTITAAYVAAILIWYGVRWILRFVRYID
ncbi:hypothetical protein [Geobacillus sp. LEMMY01]|uniref:hypothetical protein n=1 Tax=Geobacillus sp. LEMMY01 TaxID=1954237 RepID=UPI0009AD9428|nr:hypothetical protein [Geobacillus sp. LEMMY01]OPX01404.1 hypothetical protein B1A75_15810 [Geobacillus sp. LEMMY01]OPX01411.1 hypothetical protein B1A75_15845 [Geobacillus sp. LEMMY01]